MKIVDSSEDLAGGVEAILASFGVPAALYRDGSLEVTTPVSGQVIGRVHPASPSDVNGTVEAAHAAFLEWRNVPAPKRGELVRLFGEELRANKPALGHLVTVEAGKILSEGLGEVQEMIDICDFAVG
ncbi:MAG: aldehyde dehydrogenase family protein, partial [Rhodomicrobium sp.]|nr:aldehyde dehydrogenase family protein [Rhodomicrobium sp.]